MRGRQGAAAVVVVVWSTPPQAQARTHVHMRGLALSPSLHLHTRTWLRASATATHLAAQPAIGQAVHVHAITSQRQQQVLHALLLPRAARPRAPALTPPPTTATSRALRAAALRAAALRAALCAVALRAARAAPVQAAAAAAGAHARATPRVGPRARGDADGGQLQRGLALNVTVRGRDLRRCACGCSGVCECVQVHAGTQGWRPSAARRVHARTRT